MSPSGGRGIARAVRGTSWWALALIAVALTGCAAPRAELAAYRRSFDALHQSTEQHILEGRLALARWYADKNNPEPQGARDRKRDAIKDALDARLTALDAVVAYNDALTGLLCGADPKEIKGTLDSLADSVTKLAPDLARYAGPAAPAMQVVSSIAAAIEDAARMRRFTAAVIDAEKVMPHIFDLLAADIASLTDVAESEQLAARAGAQKRVHLATIRAETLLNGYAAGPGVQSCFDRINACRTAIEMPAVGGAAPQTLAALQHTPRAAAAGVLPAWVDDSGDGTVFFGLANEAAAGLEEWKLVMQRTHRLKDLTDAYTAQVHAAKATFSTLGHAVRNPSVDWTTAVDRTARAIRGYREARIALEEAR